MNKPYMRSLVVAIIFSIVIVSPIPSFSQQDEIKPIVDPDAEKLVREMGDTLKSAKTLSFHSDITFDEVLPTGQKIQFGGSSQTFIKRPDKAFVRIDGDRNKREFWYSDKQITILDTDTDFYGQIPAPQTIDGTMDYLMTEYDFSIPLADIIYSDPYESFMNNATIGVVVGEGLVNDAKCQHLAFVEKYIDWQIWISNGEKKLPCKLVITYKTTPGSPQFSAVFSDWKLNEKIADSVFKPDLPEGASKIEFLKINKSNGEAK